MTSINEYRSRRQLVANNLPPDSLAIIPAASEVYRNGDAQYRFRQDSDFYYLTGSNESDGLLIITSGTKSESILFNLPKNPELEQWTGIRLGQSEAVTALGVDAAYSLDDCDSSLIELLSDKQAVYSFLGRFPEWDERIHNAWLTVKRLQRKGISAPAAFCDLTPIVSELRLIKSDAEIALMQQAADISVNAHKRVMGICRQAENEHQLEAELVYEFLRHGCRSVAYDPIVASGKNACILHYTANNQPLKPGELILIDAGGEYHNYAADITRTFPVNGRFTGEQRAIYELVLSAQKAALDCVRPGKAWNEMQLVILRTLTRGLVDLGLLKGRVDDLIAQGAYKTFYMHNSGHWLGLDVHDSGAYKINKQWRALQPGMVLTVEPGIYIKPNHPNVDERWLGIGVRIEDDILVTKSGYMNLTKELPVEVQELEALIRG